MIPKVSIIVPVYNVEKYFDRCMYSLVNQDIKDIEIILVDDGSPDNCPILCDNWALKDCRIKVIHQKNGGLGYARNSGIDCSTGEYIAFVDSDDYVEHDFFSTLFEVACKNNADACISGNTDDKEDTKIKYPHPYSGIVFKGKEIQDVLLSSMLGSDKYGNNYSGMSVWRGIFKRELIYSNKICFKSERDLISEDIVFDLDFFSIAKCVAVCSATGYHYCHNGNSLTTTYKKDRFNKYCILYEYEVNKIRELDKYDIFIERIQNMYLANVRVSIMQEVIHTYKINKKIMIGNVESIINNDILVKVVNDYNYSCLPFKQRIFCELIKRKNALFVCILAFLQGLKKS